MVSQSETLTSELSLDIEEMKQLIQGAKRPRVTAKLQAVLTQVQGELAHAEMVAAKKEVGEKQACGEMMQDAEPVGAPHPPAPIPVGAYKGVEKFGWDQGEYNSAWVTIYVTLEGAGRAKDSTTCNFSKRGFDLKVEDLEGQKYRLVKDNLDKDIVPEDCKFIVKKDRIVIKLKKVKGEYSYDHWTDLTQKRPKAAASKGKKDDPMGGIMDMMKDMYDQGDDNMKKTIGESMRKAFENKQSGAPPAPPDYSSFDDVPGGLGAGLEDL